MGDGNGEDTRTIEETTDSKGMDELDVTVDPAVQTQSADVDEDEDRRIYRVVVNHEEQYSIWLASRENPNGWRDGGRSGAKAECLDYIKEVWTDMRPLSLRTKMEEMQKTEGKTERKQRAEPHKEDARDDLVGFLATGEHPVEASLRPEKTVKRLKEVIDRGYLHITFTDTRGGTELGFGLDAERSDCSTADFEGGTGSVHVEGGLILNSARVRCMADIDLASLSGTGHLERVEDDKADHNVADEVAASRADQV